MELNVYGEFAPGPWKTNSEIMSSINSNRDEWFPSKVELRALAASGSGKVEGAVNIWNLFCAIVRTKPSRVNIFTHAISGYIGLSGRVVKGNVIFGAAEATSLSVALMKETEEENSSFSDLKTKDVTMGDVRTALGSHAQVAVYACHSGLNGEYLRQIAKFLRVSVGGFEDEIRYHPTLSADKKSISWQYSVGDGPKVKDFHKLTPEFVKP